MNRAELDNQMQKVRALLQDTYKKIQLQKSSVLPSPNVSVHSAGRLIQQEQYDVVVCGEVKKGKSSFINALMGDQVLPVATKEATCQVFRVLNSEVEEYNLVFTDGTKKPISRKELSRYGSQVDADLYGDPIMDGHQLDYIEVKHPIPALPKSVALVDTPGIGAVYAAHEQITRNYLRKASAVIFIMSPENPLVKEERDFIESILKETNQVMFVMTKMDDYDENVIDRMICRNMEILAPYTSKIVSGKIKIQPVSSTLLFDATKEKDDIMFAMSNFEEVKDTLMWLIYNTIGFGISAEVFNAFNKYNSQVMQVLNELKSAASSNTNVAQEIAEKKRQRQLAFSQDWGTNGAKIHGIQDSIRSEIRGLENNAKSLFSQSNSIFRSMQNEIDNLTSNDQAERLSRSINSRLVDSYGKAWKDIMEQCEENIENILVQYNDHLSNIDVDSESFVVDSFRQKNRSVAEKLASGRNSYFTGAFVASIFAVPMAIVAAPVTAAIAIIGGLLGIGAGWATKKDTELKQWKQNLKEHLQKCYTQIYDNFLVKATNGKTKLQEFEEDIMKQSTTAIQRIYEQHKKNLDHQMQQLEEQVKADAEARNRKRAEVEQMIKSWNPIYDNLNQAKIILTQMEEQRQTL